MAIKHETVQFNLPLELPKADFDAVVRISKSDVVSTLQSWVPYWVRNQVGGGIMLQPDHIEYLNKLKPDGAPFKDASEIVKYVERALGREDGQHTFPVAVDPAKLPSIEQRAKECSVTTEDLIARAINLALSHPDLMNICATMDQPLVFDRDEYRELAKLTGVGTPYGVDVLAALRKLKSAAAGQPAPAGARG